MEGAYCQTGGSRGSANELELILGKLFTGNKIWLRTRRQFTRQWTLSRLRPSTEQDKKWKNINTTYDRKISGDR